jgi:regulator of protease activity HflC (stomatin/prohibitin superfamily)
MNDDANSVPEDAPFEYEAMDVEESNSPRRAASARFEVESDVGSEAALRGAMDPANQSLAEALRLSFRVLQLVIVVLLLLFLVSSFQTVREDQGGVFTQFGRIKPLDGSDDLTPGLKWGRLPYPITEFVLFNLTNRSVDVGNTFAPFNRGESKEKMLEGASVTTPLQPARDGSLVTRDGDLVHMRISARYSIDSARVFVESVDDSDPSRDAQSLVRLALESAAVLVVAEKTAQDVTERTEEVKASIRDQAQANLDRLRCGLVLGQVDINEAAVPLAIEKANEDLQSARVEAEEAVLNARRQAEEQLIRAAGSKYRQIADLITQYEEALDSGQETDSVRLLAAINTQLDALDVAGDVARVIGSARTYQSQIEASLGSAVQRFNALLGPFRENPQLVIRKHWLETFAAVLNKPDVEIVYVPNTLGMAQLLLNGSDLVQQRRREARLQQKERRSVEQFVDPAAPFIRSGSDMVIGQPGRQLKLDASGKPIAPGSSQ